MMRQNNYNDESALIILYNKRNPPHKLIMLTRINSLYTNLKSCYYIKDKVGLPSCLYDNDDIMTKQL